MRDLRNAQNLTVMRKKVAVFTAFYVLMGIELVFRLIDFMAWIYIGKPLGPGLGFASTFDGTYSAAARSKQGPRADNAPYTLIQTAICITVMLLNSGIWLYMPKFSQVRHTIHYYVCSFLVLMLLPSPAYGSTTGVKFSFMTVSLFLFQLALAVNISPTGLHQGVTCLVNLCYMILQFKKFHKVKFKTICVWDSYFHVAFPVILVLVLGYFTMVDQLRKEQKLTKKNKDLENIVGNLS